MHRGLGAAAEDDGNRAWVIRDAMKEQRTPVAAAVAQQVRALLVGVRRSAGEQSTSEASAIASRFVGLEGLTDAAVRQQGQRQRMSVGRT